MTNLLRDDIEYLVHCEPDGTVIGPLAKGYAHLLGVRTALTHYSTWSMVFHPQSGTYGIQLKNPKKHDKFTAGKWDMGVAGHNCYVKEKDSWRYLGFEENLAKEAEEEIGLKLSTYDSLDEFKKNISNTNTAFIFDKFHYKTETDNEYVGLGFIIVTDQKTNFNDDEVTDFKWLTPEELKEFLSTNTNYCKGLPMVFEKAEKFRTEVLSM